MDKLPGWLLDLVQGLILVAIFGVLATGLWGFVGWLQEIFS